MVVIDGTGWGGGGVITFWLGAETGVDKDVIESKLA